MEWVIPTAHNFHLRFTNPTSYVIREWSPQLTLPYLCVVLFIAQFPYYNIFSRKTPPKKNCPGFWAICQVFFIFCHPTPVSYNIFLKKTPPKNFAFPVKFAFFAITIKNPTPVKKYQTIYLTNSQVKKILGY